MVAGGISLIRSRSAALQRPEAPAFLASVLLFAPLPFFMNQSFMAAGDLTVASALLAVVTLLLPVGMLFTVISAARNNSAGIPKPGRKSRLGGAEAHPCTMGRARRPRRSPRARRTSTSEGRSCMGRDFGATRVLTPNVFLPLPALPQNPEPPSAPVRRTVLQESGSVPIRR